MGGWAGKSIFVCGLGVSITLIYGVVGAISSGGVCEDVLPLPPMRKTRHGQVRKRLYKLSCISGLEDPAKKIDPIVPSGDWMPTDAGPFNPALSNQYPSMRIGALNE